MNKKVQMVLVVAAVKLGFFLPSMAVTEKHEAVPQTAVVELHSEAETDEQVELQGFVIGEPEHLKATNEWRFKFAPKKNKKLEDIYMVVTVPATNGKNRVRYYLGGYVKIKTKETVIRAAVEAKSRGIAAAKQSSQE